MKWSFLFLALAFGSAIAMPIDNDKDEELDDLLGWLISDLDAPPAPRAESERPIPDKDNDEAFIHGIGEYLSSSGLDHLKDALLPPPPIETPATTETVNRVPQIEEDATFRIPKVKPFVDFETEFDSIFGLGYEPRLLPTKTKIRHSPSTTPTPKFLQEKTLGFKYDPQSNVRASVGMKRKPSDLEETRDVAL